MRIATRATPATLTQRQQSMLLCDASRLFFVPVEKEQIVLTLEVVFIAGSDKES